MNRGMGYIQPEGCPYTYSGDLKIDLLSNPMDCLNQYYQPTNGGGEIIAPDLGSGGMTMEEGSSSAPSNIYTTDAGSIAPTTTTTTPTEEKKSNLGLWLLVGAGLLYAMNKK